MSKERTENSNAIKGTNISFRCTEREKKLIKDRAEKVGKSMGTYMISACLDNDKLGKQFAHQKNEIVCRLQSIVNQLEHIPVEYIDVAEIREELNKLCQK